MASNADYRRWAKEVNPFVDWDLSRRRRFSASERRQITTARRELARLRAIGLTPVRVRRAPGESDRAYRDRLRTIKRGHGARGSTLAAVGVRKSSGERVRVSGTRVTVRKKQTGRRQWFVAFDGPRIADDATRAAEVRRAWDEAQRGGAERVTLAMGQGRRTAFINITSEDVLFDEIEHAVMLYASILEHILVGLYAERGARRKTRGP